MSSGEAASLDKDLSVGFIGAGRMCQALSKGFIAAGLVSREKMMCSDVSDDMLDSMSRTVGIRTTKSNSDVVRECQVIVIAVKPHLVKHVLSEATQCLSDDSDQRMDRDKKLFVSIAAGITIQQIEQWLPSGTHVIRVMPNTPALIQCAASVYSSGTHVSSGNEQLVKQLFSSIGYCTSLPERYLDAVTGLSGSGPAYVFMAIESLADGGVKMGLPRDIAQQLAAHTLMGAAKMVLETGEHPGQLKDAVCSPGGTTIAAVHHLETSGFRSALIGAVETATNKSRDLTASNNV